MIKKNLRFKLTLLFFLITLFAATVAGGITACTMGHAVRETIKQYQIGMAETILELYQTGEYAAEDLARMFDSPVYEVNVAAPSGISLSAEERDALDAAGYLFLTGKTPVGGGTVIKTGDRLLRIRLHLASNLSGNGVYQVITALVFCLVIGTGITLATGDRVLRPIRELGLATREIAKGNFEIVVKNDSPDEIGDLTRSFNRMTRELKQIEYLRRDFVSSVSHEFNTPLASIQGFAKLLQRNDLTEQERREYIEIILEETARLARQSANLLKLSRLENQNEVSETETFSLDEQVRRTLLLLEPKWSAKNLDMDIDLDPVAYQGDEELLKQVWINLIDNAVKFTDPGGKVTVRLSERPADVLVTIEDTGIGLTEEESGRIFEKFYQADKSRSRDGSGLGLPLVRRIVVLCGGEISVQSKKGKGTLISVRLPNSQI